MESADLPKNTDNNTTVTFKMKGFEGQQRITMNTSALEMKISAFKLIHLIADNMEKSFSKYAGQILPIVLGHIKYQYSKPIRKYSLKTIMHILYAVGESDNLVIFKKVFPVLSIITETAYNRNDLKEVKMILKHLFLFIKTLNETNVEHKNYFEPA